MRRASLVAQKILQPDTWQQPQLGLLTSSACATTRRDISISQSVETHTESTQREDSKKQSAAVQADQKRNMSASAVGSLRERLKDGPELGDFIRNHTMDTTYSVYAPKPKVRPVVDVFWGGWSIWRCGSLHHLDEVGMLVHWWWWWMPECSLLVLDHADTLLVM